MAQYRTTEQLQKIEHWLNDESFPLERLEKLAENGYLIPVHRNGERGVMYVIAYKRLGSIIINIEFQYGDKFKKAYTYDGYLAYPIINAMQNFFKFFNIKYAMGVLND